jgi:hypothetical protein
MEKQKENPELKSSMSIGITNINNFMEGSKLYKQSKLLWNRLNNEYKVLSLDSKKTLFKQYIDILRKLAYTNNSEAQYMLGVLYDDIDGLYVSLGNSLKYNSEKAVYWYQRAANNNDVSACNNLASMYISGTGCKRDIRKAIFLYEKAIDLGETAGYVKENYLYILKEVNCAVLSNHILKVVEEPVIISLFEEKKRVVSKWEIDSNGRVQRLLSIEEANDFFTSVLHRIENDIKGQTFVMNKHKVQKIIRIDFPTVLMKYYYLYKSETNPKDLSKIDFLKYKTKQYLLHPLFDAGSNLE